jgi:hypothetical protein
MSGEWLDREALVVVKAYPNPSAKHFETVCVAAITREEGWVRLYPVGFRSLPQTQRFKEYQRIRLRMKKHERDRRPESFRPDEQSIELLKEIGRRNGWRERWQWVRPTIGPTMCALQRLQNTHRRSLGCVKAREVHTLIVEEANAEWSGRKQAVVDQLVLFDPVETRLEKIPFVFKYRYRCEEPDCRGHAQSIIDWELMELYRKVRDRGATPAEISAKIRQKFLGELCDKSKDTHFFVGNHSLYPNTFMVLGVFWPPATKQSALF